MSVQLPIADERRIIVTFRLEPGCLGPQGASHIESFCRFARYELEADDDGFSLWHVVPRYDKSLAEMEYSWQGRTITRDQAGRYLQALQREFDAFEKHMQETIVHLIEVYFERH